MNIIITVAQPNSTTPKSNTTEGIHIILRKDDWNDYGYSTSFYPIVAAPKSEYKFLKRIRIIAENQPYTTPLESGDYENGLPDNFCSLAWGIQYYKDLLDLFGATIARKILFLLRDVALDKDRYKRFEHTKAAKTSLLRFGSSVEALDLAPQLFGAILEDSRLSFIMRARQSSEDDSETKVEFNFEAYDILPSRINLLIGPNGVGKTQMLAKLAIAISGYQEDDEIGSSSQALVQLEPRPSLYFVLALSFSAFDDFERPEGEVAETVYQYCGLRDGEKGLRSPSELPKMLDKLLERITPAKRKLFDRHFRRFVDDGLLADGTMDDMKTWINAFFLKASAGRRIALLTLLNLVVHCRPNSLILFDEPETHLHPALAAELFHSLQRFISDEDVNSYCIMATHSPIIAQQIPARYVNVIKKDAKLRVPVSKKPNFETFGENLDTLSRELFEVFPKDNDFYDILEKMYKGHGEGEKAIEKVESIFQGKLGLAPRMYLRSLV